MNFSHASSIRPLKTNYKRMKKFLFLFSLMFWGLLAAAQHEEQVYTPDPNPRIQQRIGEWQDIKFGLLMHWGPYSQWGIVESWSICPEDE